MKVKDLIKLLRQYDENAEIGMEAYEITEDYDYEDNLTLDYDYYIADYLTIEQDSDKLLIIPNRYNPY